MTGESVISWPTEHTPDASAFHAVNELQIPAEPEVVWAWLARPDLWPRYYSNARLIKHLGGPWPELELGSRWRWLTFGAFVTSEVVEYQLGERRGARHLRAELRGNPPRLLPVTRHDAGEVVGERLAGRRVRLWAGADLIDQTADLIVDEHLVADLGERRERLRARLGAGCRHHRPLVPAEQRGGTAEVVNLTEAIAELFEGAHCPESSRRAATPAAARPRKRPQRGPRASADAGGPSADGAQA